jgi:isoleucyl-tRNA synthetase
MDRWILQRTQDVLSRCREAYDDCEFHVVYHTLNNFCSVDLSAQYLDIVKDRLYCEGTKSKTRRAAQTTLARILDVLVHLMAPILSFTAEEIWTYLPDKKQRPGSVFLSQIPTPDTSLVDQGLADKWDRIFKERSEVLKALEQARNAGIIGHSLDAKVMFEPRNGDQSSILRQLVESDQTRLQDLLIVSQATVAHASGSAVEVSGYDTNLLNCRIMVNKADGAKCERCWKYDTEVGKDPTHPSVCARCAKVLRAGAGA